MADEGQGQTAVNSQDTSAASASAEGQGAVATPPAGENSAASQGSENRVPQTRFNEVVEQRNKERMLREQYEAKIRDLESRSPSAGPQKDEVADNEVRRLVNKLGMSEEAAREIVDSQMTIARSQREVLERQNNQFRAQEWTRQKAMSDPEYRALQPELESAFNSKSPQMQFLIASNPEMLEMFYDSVKAGVASGRVKDAYTKGVDEAYRNKASKAAVSSVPGAGAAPIGVLTRASIKAMSNEEYQKRLPEINEAIKSGKLK